MASSLAQRAEQEQTQRHLSGGPVVKNLPANAGDMGSMPGLGRFHMMWGNYTCMPHN